MNYLFIHQNTPGQFEHIASRLAADANNRVVFIGHPNKRKLPNVVHVEYTPHRQPADSTHTYLRDTERAVIYGQDVARAALKLRKSGFAPDAIIGHPGWGEMLFLKDIFPTAKMINYCEFYYNATGSNLDFDPEYPTDAETVFRTRIRNAHHLLSLEAADELYAPTHWQRAQFPTAYQDRISVIHDGINCERAAPNPNATIRLQSGLRFGVGDEVITYVARNLEPYRGFHTFMRALPAILEARPKAHVVIVGTDDVSYGKRLTEGDTYRKRMMREVKLPKGRVHFVGRIPYDSYLKLLQVSAAHIYLTYPFVLSWSCLEAMASGCILIGSRTPPVEEVIKDEQNGFLFDFFNSEELAKITIETLANPSKYSAIRVAARLTVQSDYALNVCLQKLEKLLHRG